MGWKGVNDMPRGWFGDSKRHADAGRLGGKAQGKRKNPGNFANDREKAKRAGHKGGMK